MRLHWQNILLNQSKRPWLPILMTDIQELYPHDKAAGLAVINPYLIAVCNDDDFGVTGKGFYESKILPYIKTVDKNSIYFIKLKDSLK